MSEKLEFDLVVKNNQLGKSLEEASKASGKFEESLKSAKSEMVKTSQEGTVFKNVMQTAMGVFTGSIALNFFSSLKSSIGEAIAESVNFKRAQLEIETILPANTKLTRDLVLQLEDLSKQYGTSPTSQAKAYYQIISAGVQDAADGAKLLFRANELATGGITDTARTIDLLTTIYNVYGKEIATAAEASDSLFKTVQLGKTTIPELSQSLGEVLPVAKNLGIGLDEVGNGLALLTNAGFKTAEAGTLLNALFAAISRNGKELGPTMNSTAVQTDGLGIVIQRLAQRTNLSSDALFGLLGRQEAVKAVISLSNGGLEKYNASLGEYSNKSGVAAEASKKILEGDVGKQFDILKQNLSEVSRSFIDSFIPSTLEATKVLNDFLNPKRNTIENGFNYEEAVKQQKALKDGFESGLISVDDYEKSIANLKNSLSQIPEVITPIARLSDEIDRLKAEIGSVQNGFNELNLGPIESQLKVTELTDKLIIANAEMKKLSFPDSGNSDVKIAPEVRTKEAIDAEIKLQTELRAIKEQFRTTDETFEAQLALAKQDQTIIQNELITTQLYEQKVREADAIYQGELLKNQLLKDAYQIRAADAISLEKNEQARITASRQKVLADETAAKKGQLALEQSYQNSKNTLIGQGFALAGALAKDGSKEQFIIQKIAALAEIAIADGKARALIPAQTAMIPFPGNIAAALSLNAYVTAQTVMGASIVGAAAIKGFESGGIVGATNGPDNRIAQIRDGEMVLNANQQKSLFDMINGGGNSQPVIVQIDGREIARAVRDQVVGGFRLA